MKFVSIIKILIVLSSISLTSQEGIDLTDLTQEQLSLLEEQRNLIKTNRKIFKASLSAEQLAILENVTLTKQERQKALISTFTKVQKKLLEDNKANVKKLKARFKATLTPKQKQRIRAQLQTKNSKNKNRLQSVKKQKGKKEKKNK